MADLAHTQTPWEIGAENEIMSADGEYLASTRAVQREDDENKANAEFIVRACNAHEQLVAAVKRSHAAIDRLMARLIELDPTFMPSESNIWPALQANGEALAAAGAKP